MVLKKKILSMQLDLNKLLWCPFIQTEVKICLDSVIYLIPIVPQEQPKPFTRKMFKTQQINFRKEYYRKHSEFVHTKFDLFLFYLRFGPIGMKCRDP